MKIEFTQWLQEEIERLACKQVKEKLKVKYPVEDGWEIHTNFEDCDEGRLTICWDAVKRSLRDHVWLRDEEGHEELELRDILREYIIKE